MARRTTNARVVSLDCRGSRYTCATAWAVGCCVLLGAVVPCLAAAANPPAQLKVGDIIPAFKATSVEGIPVTVPPAEGKFLIVHFWNPEVGDSDKLATEAVVLYRRFHDKGLNSLGICVTGSPDRALMFGARWNLPWPLLLEGGEWNAGRQLTSPKIPFNIVLNSKGEIVAVDLHGDAAHARLAELLGVKLDDLIKPKPPEPRKVEKATPAFSENRDLIRGNGKVYVAAVPLSPGKVQIIWMSCGLPSGAGHWKESYTVFVHGQSELFAPYEAEIQASHDYRKAYRKIAQVPAGQQAYVWESCPVGKMFWTRVVLRDKEGRVAAIGDVAPTVSGENLIANGDFEQPATQPVAYHADGSATVPWFPTALDRAAPDSAEPPTGQVEIADKPRPFGDGKHSLVGQAADDVLVIGTRPLRVDPQRRYYLGSWIQIVEGRTVIGRLALDSRERPILVSDTLISMATPMWVFCCQRLNSNGAKEGDTEHLEIVQPELSGMMPKNQAFVRPNVIIEGGQTLIDDTFLIACEEADETTLSALPKSDDVKLDETAAEAFKTRREECITTLLAD